MGLNLKIECFEAAKMIAISIIKFAERSHGEFTHKNSRLLIVVHHTINLVKT